MIYCQMKLTSEAIKLLIKTKGDIPISYMHAFNEVLRKANENEQQANEIQQLTSEIQQLRKKTKAVRNTACCNIF